MAVVAVLRLRSLGREIRAMPPDHLVINVAYPADLSVGPRHAVLVERNQRIFQHRPHGVLLVGNGARHAVRGVGAAGVENGVALGALEHLAREVHAGQSQRLHDEVVGAMPVETVGQPVVGAVPEHRQRREVGVLGHRDGVVLNLRLEGRARPDLGAAVEPDQFDRNCFDVHCIISGGLMAWLST
jgi:hypothetical protein